MKAYTVARNSSSVFLSLTGLSIREFDVLNKVFRKYLPADTSTGRPHSLSESAHKLFFILFYFKHYCTQDLIAFIFRADQSQISRWISMLQLPFSRCTNTYIDRARKKINSLSKLKSSCPNISVIIDATERPILTPKFNQQRVYSGKKHRHTIKNQIVVLKDSKEILDVSDSYVGKLHDIKLLQKYTPELPSFVDILVDLGYLGVDKIYPHNRCLIPNKSSKNFPLTDSEKVQNSFVSSHRVRVEHVIGLMKHNQILSQEFRGSKELANLSFKSLAGLHNFKMQCRHS